MQSVVYRFDCVETCVNDNQCKFYHSIHNIHRAALLRSTFGSFGLACRHCPRSDVVRQRVSGLILYIATCHLHTVLTTHLIIL